jgi:thioester reductase-like protein
MEKNAVLLTGATGFVGSELLPRILRARPDALVYCLIRPRKGQPVEARREKILAWAEIDSGDAERVVALQGDVSVPDLGLGEHFDPVAREVGEIFNSAASPRFDFDLETARRINRDSTINVIGFALASAAHGPLRRLHHVSTAFVQGDPKRRAEGNGRPLFRNTYEQTKWEAEQSLFEVADKIPITCYRPSIIVGDSRTGRTLHFRGLYEPMKWVYIDGVTVLPIKPRLRFDAVPIDYVCDAIMALSSMPETAGGTYHLTAGSERAIDVKEYVELCLKHGRAWQRRVGEELVHEPELVSREQLPGFPEEKRREYQALFDAADQVASVLVPYTIEEQLFEDPETRQALEGTGIECPVLRDYVVNLIEYASNHHYGVPRKGK